MTPRALALTFGLLGPFAIANMASAQVAADSLGDDFFVGIWGMGSVDECANADTMAFYNSGAWAITNGGANPVEAIGAWRIDGAELVIAFSELDEPAESFSAPILINDAATGQFSMVSEFLRGGSETMFLCGD